MLIIHFENNVKEISIIRYRNIKYGVHWKNYVYTVKYETSQKDKRKILLAEKEKTIR